MNQDEQTPETAVRPLAASSSMERDESDAIQPDEKTLSEKPTPTATAIGDEENNGSNSSNNDNNNNSNNSNEDGLDEQQNQQHHIQEGEGQEEIEVEFEEEEEEVHSSSDNDGISVHHHQHVTFTSDELREQQRIATQEAIKTLDPPLGCYEKFRDWILRRLDSSIIQVTGLFVMFLVVVDGAFFFFLLVGWHGMCHPVRDCQPRNWWTNFAVQMLVLLFTYMNLVSLPWRSAQLLHIFGWSCPRRCNDIGMDLYGFKSPDLWYNIPLRPRGGITLCLFTSSITQFFNQAFRIVYYSYELSNTMPGVIWVNVFFVASMASAAAGGFWLIGEETKIRKAHPPNTFPPGLLEVIGHYMGKCKKKKGNSDGNDEEAQSPHHDPRFSYNSDDVEPDPTRDQSFVNITHATREEMRLFGM